MQKAAFPLGGGKVLFSAAPGLQIIQQDWKGRPNLPFQHLCLRCCGPWASAEDVHRMSINMLTSSLE